MDKKYSVSQCFAGRFSGDGFENYLPDIISHCEVVYIIKGTPGSGKSTLMKEVAAEGKRRGMTVTEVYCSSDATSLDGVIIEEKSLAVIDGTAPHVMEAVYPLALETIINTGDFLDALKVRERRDEIFFHADKKKILFGEGEKLLRAASVLSKVRMNIFKRAFIRLKAEKFCQKIADRERKFGSGNSQKRSFFSFGKDGEVSVKNINGLNTVYRFNGKDVSPFMLCMLREYAEKNHVPFVYAPSPFPEENIAAVFFPLSGNLFTNRSVPFGKETVINEGRFIDKKGVAESREKLRFLRKAENMIKTEAANVLSEAMIHHKKLEDIYVSALNISAIDHFTKEFLMSVFGA